MAIISLFTMAITVKCDDEIPNDEVAEVVEVEPQKSWLTRQMETNVFPFLFSLFGGSSGAGIVAAIFIKVITKRKNESDEAAKISKEATKTMEAQYNKLAEQYTTILNQFQSLGVEIVNAKDVIVESLKAIKEGEKNIEDFKKDVINQIAIVSKGTEYTMTMLVEIACSDAEMVSEGKARLVAQQKELYEKYLAEYGTINNEDIEQNQL